MTWTSAQAQDKSSRPINLVVPFAAGGSTDIISRIVAEQLSKDMGRSVIVLNRPGGAGTIGLGEVARATPDGLTLGLANISFGVNPYVVKDMPYDTEKDFVSLGQIAVVPLALAVNPSVPAKSVKEFIDLAKSKPGELSYASAGYVTTGHLSMELFSYLTGIKLVHVPYKGGASQLAAQNGEVAALFSTITTSKKAYESGGLRPLGVTTAARDPNLPDVPTIAEAGVPGYEMGDWIGVIAPKGTSPEFVADFHKKLAAALSNPDVKARIEKVGAQVRTSTPAEMDEHIKQELAKWKKVVEATGIKVE
jgi:tripartite-type tricarboxylate transporter receptor subunit TctC